MTSIRDKIIFFLFHLAVLFVSLSPSSTSSLSPVLFSSPLISTLSSSPPFPPIPRPPLIAAAAAHFHAHGPVHREQRRADRLAPRPKNPVTSWPSILSSEGSIRVYLRSFSIIPSRRPRTATRTHTQQCLAREYGLRGEARGEVGSRDATETYISWGVVVGEWVLRRQTDRHGGDAYTYSAT